jgi:hypothetical protein
MTPRESSATTTLPPVIASEAKQSSTAAIPKRSTGLLRRYAPRNDGPGVISDDATSTRHCERSEAIQRHRTSHAQGWIPPPLRSSQDGPGIISDDDTTTRHCERSEAIQRHRNFHGQRWIASSLRSSQ